MDHIAKLRRRYSVFFNFSCVFVLVIFMYNQANVDRKPILDKNPNLGSPWRSYKSHHRRLITELGPTISPNQTIPNVPTFEKDGILEKSAAACSGVARHEGYMTHCEFLRDHQQCISGGFFDYVTFFYCDCEKFHTIGFAVLGLWLMVLFYLLGNTAADYFCCNLAKLSSLLKLPPTVAGVTLLPLGNGAPDVFASITAFVGSDAGEVGLNSVLGGAVFVTCVVAGVVSLCAAEKNVQIDRKCFVRDVGFFLFTLISLSLILAVGRVGLWGAILFVLIYMVYAFVVAANELLKKHARMLKLDVVTPLLPVRGSFFSYGSEEESMYSPFLDDDVGSEVPQLHAALPQWMWASHVAIYSNHGLQVSFSDKPRSPWGWNDEDEADNWLFCSKVFSWMEMLLALPRRLTIPIVEDERWSRVYAVASASLAPVLLAFVWNTSHDEGSRSIVAYVLGSVIGVTLGILAFTFSIPDNPPRSYLFPWVSGGFVMSIVWFYIIANELVELLVALGAILGINPSILGLTVLAWGNSMGDLMSNVALALNGGDGVQIAMSGCYAGPMFNTLAGLGISMLFGAWSVVPASYELPRDSSLVFTIGFLVSGLIWALAILQRNDMRPNKMLGFGLLVLYLIFLFVRLSIAIGIISFVGSH